MLAVSNKTIQIEDVQLESILHAFRPGMPLPETVVDVVLCSCFLYIFSTRARQHCHIVLKLNCLVVSLVYFSELVEAFTVLFELMLLMVSRVWVWAPFFFFFFLFFLDEKYGGIALPLYHLLLQLSYTLVPTSFHHFPFICFLIHSYSYSCSSYTFSSCMHMMASKMSYSVCPHPPPPPPPSPVALVAMRLRSHASTKFHHRQCITNLSLPSYVYSMNLLTRLRISCYSFSPEA